MKKKRNRNPSAADAERKGRKAARAGKRREDCPYPGTSGYTLALKRAWLRGFGDELLRILGEQVIADRRDV